MSDLFSDLDFSMLGNSTTSSIDNDEFKVKVIRTLEEVLSSVFDEVERQKIIAVPHHQPTRYNFCCPYCGDSKLNPRKKRGNLYVSNLFYKCYNSGCASDKLPFIRMVDDFNKRENFTSDEILYMSNIENEGLTIGSGNGKSTIGGAFTSHLKEIDEYAIDRKYVMYLMNLIEVSENEYCWEYIINRKQNYVDHNLFAYSAYNKSLFIFNLNKRGDKIIGCQERFLQAKKNERRFTSHNYSDIVKNWIMIDDPNPDILEKMDRYGLIYNILRVNMSKKVIVLEGAINANHLGNSVATLSASNRVYFANGLYLLDNDDAGKHVSLEMLELGYPVFMWSKFLRDYPQFEHVNDINDIVKKDDKFPIESVVLDYFTNDKLDGIHI